MGDELNGSKKTPNIIIFNRIKEFEDNAYQVMKKLHMGNLVIGGLIVLFIMLSFGWQAQIRFMTKQLQAQAQFSYMGVLQVTKYTNIREQTDDSPNITSTGHVVREGICAVSQDMLKSGLLKYGDYIWVSELGRIYEIDDCMNRRHDWSVDIFTFNRYESDHFNGKFACYLIKSSLSGVKK
jgi:hypothetical protein